MDNAEVFGVSHGGSYIGGQGLVGATFAGFAADVFAQLRSAITGAGATVSLLGNIDTGDLVPHNHPVVGPAFGPSDITSTLAWDLSPAATTATIITTLGGVPEPPEPVPTVPEIPTLSRVGVAVLALALLAIALSATRRRGTSG